MKTSAPIIALLILLPASFACAQSAGVIKIKNRSSFTSVDIARNPFWPIGFSPNAVATTTPNEAQQPVMSQKPALKAEDFNLTSISSFQGTRMAMLCGKPVGEGQLVNLNLGGQRTKVQILKVTDGSVVLQCMGQEITVQLKRPEMDLMLKPAPQQPLLHSQEE